MRFEFFLKNFGVLELARPFKQLYQWRNFRVSFKVMVCEYFYYREDCCLVEIVYKITCLLEVGQVIASGEQR